MYYSPDKSRDWLLHPCIAAAQPAVVQKDSEKPDTELQDRNFSKLKQTTKGTGQVPPKMSDNYVKIP